MIDLTCEVCRAPIQDPTAGIDLFYTRRSKKHLPDNPRVVHKTACDNLPCESGYT